ncbi:MAG: hypothetical protein P8Y60_04705 [Calditrichota bacterium]
MAKLRTRIVYLFIFVFVVIVGCQSKVETNIPAAKKRELANAFYNQQLYQQAVEEYIDYLNRYRIDNNEQANVTYMIANIYFDRLHDYENALAYYLRLKYLYPNSNLQNESNKKVVECLERLKRSTDAQQVIEQTAALDESQKPKSRPGEVIAKIGDREFTTGDMQYELNRLPVYMREQIKTRDQKIDFLKSILAQELLYDSAKRQGLDKDKDVRAGVRKRGTAVDPYFDFGTGGTGYPSGDANKYYLLSHREWDYDQVFTASIDSTDAVWTYPGAQIAQIKAK